MEKTIDLSKFLNQPESTGNETILLIVLLIFVFISFTVYFLLNRKITELLKDYRELKKQSGGDKYVINFLTKEKEHLADLNDANESLIKTMKDVISTQESFIKELTTELEPVETKVYDSVFSLPIQEPKKPI